MTRANDPSTPFGRFMARLKKTPELQQAAFDRQERAMLDQLAGRTLALHYRSVKLMNDGASASEWAEIGAAATAIEPIVKALLKDKPEGGEPRSAHRAARQALDALGIAASLGDTIEADDQSYYPEVIEAFQKASVLLVFALRRS